jgi:hypothetical protein
MSEEAERKAWLAAKNEASAFYLGAGGEAMSSEDYRVYEGMLERVRLAAQCYAAVRQSD